MVHNRIASGTFVMYQRAKSKRIHRYFQALGLRARTNNLRPLERSQPLRTREVWYIAKSVVRISPMFNPPYSVRDTVQMLTCAKTFVLLTCAIQSSSHHSLIPALDTQDIINQQEKDGG